MYRFYRKQHHSALSKECNGGFAEDFSESFGEGLSREFLPSYINI